MALGLSDELIADIGGALIARLDGGSGPATFDVYTAPRPARPQSPLAPPASCPARWFRPT